MHFLFFLLLLLSCDKVASQKDPNKKMTSSLKSSSDWDEDDLSNQLEIELGQDPYLYNHAIIPSKIFYKTSDKRIITYSPAPLEIYKNFQKNDYNLEHFKIFYSIEGNFNLSEPTTPAYFQNFTDNLIKTPNSIIKTLIPSFDILELDLDSVGLDHPHFQSIRDVMLSNQETYLLVISTPHYFSIHKISRLFPPREFLKKYFLDIFNDFEKNFKSWKHNFSESTKDQFFYISTTKSIPKPQTLNIKFETSFQANFSLKPAETFSVSLTPPRPITNFKTLAKEYLLFNGQNYKKFIKQHPHVLFAGSDKEVTFVIQNKMKEPLEFSISLSKPKFNRTEFFRQKNCTMGMGFCLIDAFKDINITTISP
jgi:hypothetical protein